MEKQVILQAAKDTIRFHKDESVVWCYKKTKQNEKTYSKMQKR